MGRVSTPVIWTCSIISLGGCTKGLHSQVETNANSFSAKSPSPTITPKCLRIGSNDEGWYLGEKLLEKIQCSGKFAECLPKDDKLVWTSFIRKNIRLIRFESCEEKAPPHCVNSGTKSEGWQAADWFQWDACTEQGVICHGIGTRSEGWYSYEQDAQQPIGNYRCDKL